MRWHQKWHASGVKSLGGISGLRSGSGEPSGSGQVWHPEPRADAKNRLSRLGKLGTREKVANCCPHLDPLHRDSTVRMWAESNWPRKPATTTPLRRPLASTDLQRNGVPSMGDNKHLGIRVNFLRNSMAVWGAVAVLVLAIVSPFARAARTVVEDEVRLGKITSAAQVESASLDLPNLIVKRARVPLFVEVDVEIGSSSDTLADAVDLIIEALDSNPRRLVTIRCDGAALCFAQLTRQTQEILIGKCGNDVVAAYNDYVASRIGELIRQVRVARPGAALSVQGIPFEGGSREVASANVAYEPVLDALSAIVVGKLMMVTDSAGEVGMIRRICPHAIAFAGGRAVFFAANGGWRVAIEVESEVSNSVPALADVRGAGEALGELGTLDDDTGDVQLLGSPNAGDPSASSIDGTERAELAGAGSSSETETPATPGGGGQGGSGGAGWPGGVGSGGASESTLPQSSGADENAGNDGDDLPDGANGNEDEGIEDEGVDSEDGGGASDDWDPEDEVIEDDTDPSQQSDSESEGDVANPDDLGDDSMGENAGGSGSDEGGSDSAGGDQSGESEEVADASSSEEDAGWAQVLPGSGWAAPVEEQVVGSTDQETASAKCIAHWTQPPFQTINQPTVFGLVAFHINGIAEVRFSYEGGPWTVVTQPTFNASTDLFEYAVELDPSQIGERLGGELRAIVVPRNSGTTRVLSDLVINSRPGWNPTRVFVSPDGNDEAGTGTASSPVRTIWGAIVAIGNGADANGTEVCLLPGRYEVFSGFGSIPDTSDSWLVIRSAPGVDSGDVVLHPPIGENVRLRVGKLMYRDVTFDLSAGGGVKGMGSGPTYCWMDNVSARGAWPESIALAAGQKPLNGASFSAAYCTNSEFDGFEDGPLSCVIVNNVELVRCQGDLFSYCHLVANSTGTDCGTQPGAHRDYFQLGNDEPVLTLIENRIMMNTVIRSSSGQGVYAAGDNSIFANIAIINVHMETMDPAIKGQWLNPSNHVLFWHYSSDQAYVFRSLADCRNFSVIGCVFRSAGCVEDIPAYWESCFRSNHFEQGPAGIVAHVWGLDSSTGDLGSDFLSSPEFEDRIDDPVLIFDSVNQLRSMPDDVGVYAGP